MYKLTPKFLFLIHSEVSLSYLPPEPNEYLCPPTATLIFHYECSVLNVVCWYFSRFKFRWKSHQPCYLPLYQVLKDRLTFHGSQSQLLLHVAFGRGSKDDLSLFEMRIIQFVCINWPYRSFSVIVLLSIEKVIFLSLSKQVAPIVFMLWEGIQLITKLSYSTRYI